MKHIPSIHTLGRAAQVQFELDTPDNPLAWALRHKHASAEFNDRPPPERVGHTDDALENYLRAGSPSCADKRYIEANRSWLSRLSRQTPGQIDFASPAILRRLRPLAEGHGVGRDELVFLIRIGAGLAREILAAPAYRGGPLPLKNTGGDSVAVVNADLLNRGLCWYFMALAALQDAAKAAPNATPDPQRRSDVADDGVFVLKDPAYRLYNFLKSNPKMRSNTRSAHFAAARDQRIKLAFGCLPSRHRQKINALPDGRLPGGANRMHYGSLPGGRLFFRFKQPSRRDWLASLPGSATPANMSTNAPHAQARLAQLNQGVLRPLYTQATQVLDLACRERLLDKTERAAWARAIADQGFVALDERIDAIDARIKTGLAEKKFKPAHLEHCSLSNELAALRQMLADARARYASPLDHDIRRGAEIQLDPDPACWQRLAADLPPRAGYDGSPGRRTPAGHGSLDSGSVYASENVGSELSEDGELILDLHGAMPAFGEQDSGTESGRESDPAGCESDIVSDEGRGVNAVKAYSVFGAGERRYPSARFSRSSDRSSGYGSGRL